MTAPDCFADQLNIERRGPFSGRLADVSHADGSTRRVRFSGVPVYRSDQFAGFRGIARDETRQMTASDATERAESRLLQGLSAIRDGFAVFDQHGLLICANAQLVADLGRHEPPPQGTELGKLLNHALKSGWFVDTDAPSLTAARPRLVNPTDGHSMIEIGLADGRRVLFAASHTPLGDTVLISTDITELNLAQDLRRRRASLKSA